MPTGANSYVTVKGRSGNYIQQQNLKQKIKGSEVQFEDITSIITDLINTALKEIARLPDGK